VSQGQEHETTDSYVETDSREGEAQGH